MSPFGGGKGGKHPGRATADHHDLLRYGGRLQLLFLMAGPGIALAFHRLVLEDMVEAALTAGDAVDDPVVVTGRRLLGKTRIGDKGPADRDQVAEPFVDEAPRGLRVIDPMTSHDRNRHLFLDFARHVGKDPARHLSHDLRHLGLMPTDVDADGIGAGGGQGGGKGLLLGPADPAFHEIVAVDPDDDRYLPG